MKKPTFPARVLMAGMSSLVLVSSAGTGRAAEDPLLRTWAEAPTAARARAIGSPHFADPTLKPGFPVAALHTAGTYHGGPAVHCLIAEVDGDPELEIIAVGLADGPVYAWNHDGTLVPGWPVVTGGSSYPAAGPLASGGAPAVVIAIEKSQSEMTIVNGAGSALAGWPRGIANYVDTPPSVADVVGDRTPEVFLEEQDWALHGYSSGGASLPGWPVGGAGGQERHTPAIADLDGDGAPEILTGSGATTPGVYLHVYRADGTVVSGFPFNLEPSGYGTVDLFPVVGDVDHDGAPEIVVCNKRDNRVYVLGGGAQVERTMRYAGFLPYTTAPALGDLNRDGTLEIVIQTDDSLNVLESDGTAFPGWPIGLGEYRWMGSSGPVIGDVDGDGDLDIAITTQEAGSSVNGDVRVYDSGGAMLAGFPKVLPVGSGAVPAIADLDRDGRNDLIVCGSFWDGYSGLYPKVWAFDLGGSRYGGIEWGQFMHDAGHTGFHPGSSTVSVPPTVPAGRSFAAWPNPARVGSAITFSIAETVPNGAAVAIHDVQGRRLRTLAADRRIAWDGRDAAGVPATAGVYVVRLGSETLRLVMVR